MHNLHEAMGGQLCSGVDKRYLFPNSYPTSTQEFYDAKVSYCMRIFLYHLTNN